MSEHTTDWEQFCGEVTWFIGSGESAVVGGERPWTRGPVDGLPVLSELLGSATVTPASVAGRTYEVLAWGPRDDRRGWLCHAPQDTSSDTGHRTHRAFWAVCGGVVEWFGEPESWWMNQDEVLTVDAARLRPADVLADYSWIWDDEGIDIPVRLDDYYTVAIEANGNLTMAHREHGGILLFAPDHAFSGVSPLPGCPPYSLLTIDGIPDIATWIEACATVWNNPHPQASPRR